MHLPLHPVVPHPDPRTQERGALEYCERLPRIYDPCPAVYVFHDGQAAGCHAGEREDIRRVLMHSSLPRGLMATRISKKHNGKAATVMPAWHGAEMPQPGTSRQPGN